MAQVAVRESVKDRRKSREARARSGCASPDAIERVVAEPVLLDFQRMLGENPGQDADEQEFIMAMHKTWEEGKAETRANAVLTVLRVRGIAVPDAVRQQILAQQDLQRLEQWLEKTVVATSIGDVIDTPN